MRQFYLLSLFFTICLSSLLLASPCEAKPTSAQAQALVSAVNMEAQSLMANPGYINSLTAFQLGIAINEIAWNPALAQSYVSQYGLSQQDMNPSDAGYGSFGGEDANTTAFAGLGMAVFWNRVHHAFSPSYASVYQAQMEAAGTWLMNHPINGDLSYTNIYLMTSVDLVLLGEASGNATIANRGYAQLESWYKYTKSGGIAEFISPTYTAVDLQALNMGYIFAQSAANRVKMKAALDFIWADVKANFFVAQGSLAGAHSRDYDWLQGIDFVDMNLYILTEANQNSFPFQGGVMPAGAPTNIAVIYLLENTIFGNAYHPDWNTLPGTNNYYTPTFVSESFPLGQTSSGLAARLGKRNSYTNQTLSISSTSSNATWQDKLFNISLNTRKPDFAQITLNVSADDNPFGEDDYDTAVALGTNVHNHSPVNPASVQDGSAVLTSFDIDPQGVQTDLATSLIIPWQADSIVVNGAPFNPAGMYPGQEIPVPNNSRLEIREGNSGVVLQFSIVDRLNGMMPALALRMDSFDYYNYIQNQTIENVYSTRPLRVLRLVAHHYQGAPLSVTQTHLRGVIYANATTVTSPSQWQAFKNSVEAHWITLWGVNDTIQWSSSVVLPSGETLTVLRWLDDPNSYRGQINGVSTANPIFSVNGKDLTKSLSFFGAGI